MRILPTSGPVRSHFAPTVAPVAAAVRRAGHEVPEESEMVAVLTVPARPR